jgi:hypothetical protein
MITISLTKRVVGGLLALGLLAIAAVAAPRPADACVNCTPPQSHVPIEAQPSIYTQLLKKPDLVVWIQKADCSNGVVSLKIRVQNMADHPTTAGIWTDVKVDGVMVPGAPHFTNAPMWGGQVFHLNAPAAPGRHIVTAFADSQFNQAESNEANNGASTSVSCP